MSHIRTYVLRSVAGPFLFGLGVATFLLLIDVLYRYVDLLVAKHVPLAVVGEILFLSLGPTFALSVPMAVLIGILMGFGQLGADNELLAFQACGVGYLGLLRPVLLFAAIVGVGLGCYNQFVLPVANHRLANRLYDIAQAHPLADVQPREFEELREGLSIWIGGRDGQSGRMENVRIIEWPQDGEWGPKLTTAAWGVMVPVASKGGLILELHDGEVNQALSGNGGRNYRIARFVRQDVFVGNTLRGIERHERTARGDREMDMRALWVAARQAREARTAATANMHQRAIEVTREQYSIMEGAGTPAPSQARPPQGTSPSQRGVIHEGRLQAVRDLASSANGTAIQIEALRKTEARYLVEFHKKLSIPFACLVFAIVGLPLSMTRAREGRSGALPVVMAIYLVYYLQLVAGEKLADRGIVSPIVAMWSMNVVLLCVSVPVTLRALDVDVGLWGVARSACRGLCGRHMRGR